jgi:hypothetical protein
MQNAVAKMADIVTSIDIIDELLILYLVSNANATFPPRVRIVSTNIINRLSHHDKDMPWPNTTRRADQIWNAYFTGCRGSCLAHHITVVFQ